MAKVHKDQFNYTEHERKPIIRSQWCLPQIDLLYKKLGNQKLIYIGLPGIEALDIKAWLVYLKKVIAFQCSEYKEGKTTKMVDVAELDKFLEDLERKQQLQSSIVYQGFMEDIIMGALSERGQKYSQDEFLKIYNLDFCNNIATPRVIRSENGKVIYHYKLEVIDKLLEYERFTSESGKGSRFLMYLTVNSNIFNAEFPKVDNPEISAYVKMVKKITKPEVQAVRLMKSYCFHELTKIFNNNKFHAEFLPPIFYQGSSYPNQNKGSKSQYHRMMTFTILGTKLNDGTNLYNQDAKAFLNSKFLFANNQSILCFNDKFIEETAYNADAVELITKSHTYTNLW